MLDLSFYWITRLDALNTMFVLFIVFGAVACVVVATLRLCLVILKCDEEEYKTGKVLLKVSAISLVVFIVGILGNLFIPTTKEYCAIKVVEYLESNEKACELPDKIIDKAYEYFDSELKVDTKDEQTMTSEGANYDTRGKTQIQ